MSKAFIDTLESVFKDHEDKDKAQKMQAYLKDKFVMFGINAPLRETLSQPFLTKEFLPPKEEANQIIEALWNKPQREYHYFAQQFAFKYAKKWVKSDIALLENMITTHSWWDTVDFIAAKLLGSYFKLFPEQIEPVTTKWLNSGNIWLQRSCLLFQLKYKKDLNTELLSRYIHQLNGSKEFFINKAIGWVLREYARINPEWVRQFVNNTPLSNLSKREALKHLA
jgi:3-methyladenine DNA glycosylase AlkD